MSDDKVLMLSPVTEPNWVPGAVEVSADCGHQCWISPSGLLLQLGGGVTTRCQDCIVPADVAEISVVPGSQDELTALIGKQATADVLAAAARDPAGTVRDLQAQSRRTRKRTRR